MGQLGGADVVSWFLLPAVTLVAWGVRVVGSLRRREASYGLMPVLGATVLALVLLVASFVLPGHSSVAGRLGVGDVVAVNAIATLVLVLALGALEVPLWGARTVLDSVRRRRLLAPDADPTPWPAPSAAAGPAATGLPAPALPTAPAPAAMRPDEAA